MRYLCTDIYKESAGFGDSLEETYKDYKNNGGDEYASDCEFYHLENPIKVEVQLIPKTEVVLTEAGRLPKSKANK